MLNKRGKASKPFLKSNINSKIIYFSNTQDWYCFLTAMQNKQKVDKESCQNNFDIPERLPTGIDISLAVHLRYIRGTLLFFFLAIIISQTRSLLKYV